MSPRAEVFVIVLPFALAVLGLVTFTNTRDGAALAPRPHLEQLAP